MIPDEAVEVAAQHLAFYTDRPGTEWTEEARALLEAVAPHLTGRAYNAGHLDGMNGAPNSNPYRKDAL